MFRNNGLFSSKDKGYSWWWFGVIAGIVSALILWWWLEYQKSGKRDKIFWLKSPGKGMDEENQSIPLPLEDEPTIEEEAETPEPDDLKKIEGIGPKIQATLQGFGIQTYAQLAALKPEVIKQILVEAGIRTGYPDTWPEQAALAVKGDWVALKELQGSLQGGRRVG